jgi:putative Holliday junction resolvase
METWLGFDFGTKRLGVAVGQTITGSASPLATLGSRGGRPDWDAIATLIATWRPQGLIVGLPFNMDDSEAQAAPGARRFARQLEGRFRLPVYLVDERLTSLEAERRLPQRTRRPGDVDAYAAKLILETWLSEQSAPHPHG